MSLLMDALKKAELAKRQGPEGTANQADAGSLAGLTLEPLAAPNVSDSTASNSAAGASADSNLSLASHLEELDARFLEDAATAARLAQGVPQVSLPLVDSPPAKRVQAPAGATAARSFAAPPPSPRAATLEPAAQEKAAAQNLFTAKQAEQAPGRKGFAITIGVITVLSVCGLGGYFWWQLQPRNSLLASRGPMPPAAPMLSPPPVAAPPQIAAAAPPATLATAPAAAAPAPAATTASGVIRQPSTSTDNGDEGAASPARTRAQQRRAAARAMADESDSPIRVTREALKVNPALLRGFDAFNRGDLTLAQLEYESARKADPRNTDALHGLAAIAVQQGRHDQAELLFRQIAEADPQDTVAIAALLNRGRIDPGTTESRLKSLAATQPELAAPHFSLGNLYARHGRWDDAQQAYFRAYSAEPENPDILYNLAISLEHLRQNKLSAQYYGLAIAAARTRPAGFDKAQAAARLQALQP